MDGDTDEDVSKAAPPPKEAVPSSSGPSLNHMQLDVMFEEYLTDRNDDRAAQNLYIPSPYPEKLSLQPSFSRNQRMKNQK